MLKSRFDRNQSRPVEGQAVRAPRRWLRLAIALAVGTASVVSMAPTVAAAPPSFTPFSINSLSASGCVTTDVEPQAGDSRGGIIVASAIDRVFHTGDSATARTNLNLGAKASGPRHDAMVSDVQSGQGYVLGDAGGELGSGGGVATKLIRLDANGAVTAAQVALSNPVAIDGTGGYGGLFSGYGTVVLINSNATATAIDPVSGAVTVLGSLPGVPSYEGNESWAVWGIAERYTDGTYGVVYAQTPNSIVRTRIPSGSTTTIASFPGIGVGDDPDLAASPTNDRWYWRNEYNNMVGGTDESLSYCTASYTIGGATADGVSVTAPTPTAIEGGADGAFTFTRTGDTSATLTVGYNLSGSATSGTDYDPPGTVFFPAGASTVTKPLHALADTVSDDGETVTVQVTDGVGYVAGQPAQATVTIKEPKQACANAPKSTFSDRDQIPVHAANIDCITAYGIAKGFSDGTYRPGSQVTRPQIATFLARLMAEAGVTLPASPPDAFPGDDAGPPHELSINQLAALGVLDATTGQQGDGYDVGANMRRDDMAQLLVNAYKVITSTDLPAGPNAFTDDEGNDNEAAINSLFAVGVVEGPGGGAYSPAGTVTRGQMASFFSRYIQVLVNAGFLQPLP
jgi:hypothetical protein